MIAAEPSPNLSPEDFVDNVFAREPTLPVDKLDVSGITEGAEALPPSEPGYAWERVPRWVAETEKTFGRVKGRKLGLDIGSSVPYYAQAKRAGQFARSGDRAREIERGFFADTALAGLAETEPELRPIAIALGKNEEARALLAAAVQATLYRITDDQADRSRIGAFRQYLRQQLGDQVSTYPEDRAGSDIEAGWGFRFREVRGELTYFEQLAALPVPTDEALRARERLAEDYRSETDRELARQTGPAGERLAAGYIDWQTARLADHISGNERFQPVRFLSLDYASPEAIALSSAVNTPDSTRAMNLYSHAVASLFDPYQHIVGDLFDDLPLPDHSLALITAIDSWPFNFGPDGHNDRQLDHFRGIVRERLNHFYARLAYNGRMVIFP